jgi:choline kinase
MKAIILAAGMGTRLGKYTENLPKGMLHFLGKSLIERQVENLRKVGINDILIIRGYNPEKINISGVEYAFNPEFATTNMVASLMIAEDDILSSDGILVCYSDIICEPRLLEKIKDASADVNVLCDDDYLEYWKARLDDWESDIESLQYDEKNNIIEIGTPRCPLSQAKSRYIGLIKFSKEGVAALVQAFEENRAQYWDDEVPWRKSKSFKKAYMTCMIQELADRGFDVKAVPVSRGWMEFDTVEDYEKALQWAKDGTLKKFITLR